ncbi:MAG: hypothetical protein LBQ90_12270 [Synergistaceae bacterium]|nr:hypothetical protein [Synergistaceae bacterium]
MTKIKKLLQKKGMKARSFVNLGCSEAIAYKFINRQAILPKKWRKPFADRLGVSVEDICEDNGLALLDDEVVVI